MAEKLLFTGKTHNRGGSDGSARSSDGFLDLKLSQPHPPAEELFGAAWSACLWARSNSPRHKERSTYRPLRQSTLRSTYTTAPAASSCELASTSPCRASITRSPRNWSTQRTESALTLKRREVILKLLPTCSEPGRARPSRKERGARSEKLAGLEGQCFGSSEL